MAPKILTPEEIGNAIPSVLGIGQLYFAAQCLNAVVQLAVPDAIGDETLTASEICHRVGGQANEDALKRCLRLLALKGLFEEKDKDGDYAFALTAVGALLQTGCPQPSMACGVLHQNCKPFWQGWAELPGYVAGKTALLPFEKANGMPIFDFFASHPENAKPFNEFMSFFSAGELPVIVSSIPWKDFNGKTVVDVGGGLGTVMHAVKEANPGVNCVSFDLPEVIATVPEAPKGVETAAGSFFNASTIPWCDAILMKHILHDWSDDGSIEILSNCKQALNDGGKIFVAECLLPGPGESTELKVPQVHMDAAMMIFGGKERDRKGFEQLAKAAGLKVEGFTPTPYPTCQIITLSK